MADRYVWSGATGSADGTSWANAFTTLASAAAVDTNGDTIFVAHDHSEDTGAALSYLWTTTGFLSTTWCRILCVNRTSGLETTGAQVQTTGNFEIKPGQSGQGLIFGGINFVAGNTATGTAQITLGQNTTRSILYKNCTFNAASTGSSNIVAQNNGLVLLKNCNAKFGHSGGTFSVTYRFEWNGGSLLSGSQGTVLVTPASAGNALLTNLDLSNGPAGLDIFGGTGNVGAVGVITNSKLPASWTGSVSSVEPTVPSTRFSLYNCDSADTNYRLIVKDFSGTITDETTIVRTGGATDGTTPVVWKMASNANATESLCPLVSDRMVVWNETTGSSKTVTVEIIHDSVTNLTDAEVWLEVEYLGTTGFPLGTVVSDQRATLFTTAADQAASSVTWTTTGLTNPNKQKLSVAFTPQEKGFIQARVYLAKASKTVYVDCEPVVT